MIKFGPSGNSLSFYEQGFNSTAQAPKWIKAIGLDCFEYSFGRGILISDDKCAELNKAFSAENIEISVHAPYFINFANDNPESIEKSINYVLNSIKKLKIMGGTRCVVHPASCGKLAREVALSNTFHGLEQLIQRLDGENIFDFKVCLETMGKHAQIGTTEEVTAMCKMDKRFYPCMDFGHINSREGGSLKTADDYKRHINILADNLGEEKTKYMHVHFSKIEFGAKGELRHLTLEDTKYGPEFSPLAKVIREYGLQPYIICESVGVQAEDAVKLKNIYENSF